MAIESGGSSERGGASARSSENGRPRFASASNSTTRSREALVGLECGDTAGGFLLVASHRSKCGGGWCLYLVVSQEGGVLCIVVSQGELQSLEYVDWARLKGG